jgi:hypothetical protein
MTQAGSAARKAAASAECLSWLSFRRGFLKTCADLNTVVSTMSDMLAHRQAKEIGTGVGDVTPNRKLQKTFERAFTEFDSKIGRNCNLGNVVVALMNKKYSKGSPFDELFMNKEMVQRPAPCPETGSEFMHSETDKILHANVVHEGRLHIDYCSLACDHAYLHRLDSLDNVEYGARVRAQLEHLMALQTKLALEKNPVGVAEHRMKIGLPRSGTDMVWTWGVQLLASSRKARQSLLVFRLYSNHLLGHSGAYDSESVFAVVPTSSKMELDAFVVADHMVKKENYPEARVHFAPGMGS